MKLDGRSIDAFLRNPATAHAVLLHGEDAGLVHERAAMLLRAIVGSLDDPFRVAHLGRESHGQVAHEMAALSMTGGRRVVWVRDASDSLVKNVQAALTSQSPALLVIEAGFLPAKSKLRALAEEDPQMVSIACYREEGAALARTVVAIFRENQVSIDRDAVEWLSGQLGVDRSTTRQEIEKLSLYVGMGGTVDLDKAMALVGDMAGLQLDDAIFAAMEGNIEISDRSVQLAMAEGATPVAVLRAALTHLQRMQRVRVAIDRGLSVSAAAQAVRPPLFGRRLASFKASLHLWTAAPLTSACTLVAGVERDCKRTGSPADVMCRNAVAMLARRASLTQTAAKARNS